MILHPIRHLHPTLPTVSFRPTHSPVDPTPSPRQLRRVSATARSPLSGCAILIAAVLMLLFLIGFSIWVPFRQADEIEKFTQPEPAPVPVVSLEDHENAATGLVEQLEVFRSALAGEETPARVELTALDLNLAIATFPQLEELRGTFFVREIAEDHLVIDICYRLNGRPRLARDGEPGPIAADPRHLVGTLHARPLLTNREFALDVIGLNVPGAEVPAGFMGHFSTLRIFERHLQDPVIGPAMGKLTRASLENGRLILARTPGEVPPNVVSDENFLASGAKIALFLVIGLLAFLLLGGVVLFFSYRARLRQIEAEERTNPDAPDA